jgi:23S rRNA (adenine2503-C2)-methyltransferase
VGQNQTQPQPLFGLDGSALAALMVELGKPAWRGKQISKAIYCQRVMDLSEITTLPKLLRQKLFDDGWEVGRPRIVQVFRSVDGTERYLVQCTAARETVETVWMPDGDDGEAGDGSDSGEQDIRPKARQERIGTGRRFASPARWGARSIASFA